MLEQNDNNDPEQNNIDNPSSAQKRALAVDLLRKAMIFWSREGEGPRLIQKVVRQLERMGEIKLAIKVKDRFKDVIDSRNCLIDDRSIAIAAIVANYESPKLASISQKSAHTIHHVIRAQTRAKDYIESNPVQPLVSEPGSEPAAEWLQNVLKPKQLTDKSRKK
jgi:hypothetical protein